MTTTGQAVATSEPHQVNTTAPALLGRGLPIKTPHSTANAVIRASIGRKKTASVGVLAGTGHRVGSSCSPVRIKLDHIGPLAFWSR